MGIINLGQTPRRESALAPVKKGMNTFAETLGAYKTKVAEMEHKRIMKTREIFSKLHENMPKKFQTQKEMENWLENTPEGKEFKKAQKVYNPEFFDENGKYMTVPFEEKKVSELPPEERLDYEKKLAKIKRIIGEREAKEAIFQKAFDEESQSYDFSKLSPEEKKLIGVLPSMTMQDVVGLRFGGIQPSSGISGDRIRVKHPDGRTGTISASQLPQAIKAGFKRVK